MTFKVPANTYDLSTNDSVSDTHLTRKSALCVCYLEKWGSKYILGWLKNLEYAKWNNQIVVFLNVHFRRQAADYLAVLWGLTWRIYLSFYIVSAF